MKIEIIENQFGSPCMASEALLRMSDTARSAFA